MTEPAIEALWKDAVRKHLASISPEEVAELIAETRPDRAAPVGNHVPGVGNTPDSRAVERAEIAAAEAAGDWRTSFAAKAAQINRLMHKEK